MALAFRDDLWRPLSVSINSVRPRRALLFCGGAILLVAMAYGAASHGFDAVAKCEVNAYDVLGQGRSTMSQIALSSACGF